MTWQGVLDAVLRLGGNTQASLQTVSTHLESVAALAFDLPVSIKFKVIHLIVDSESERTIVAVFDRKSL